jgi:peptidyl-Lys metalloendopeptidase
MFKINNLRSKYKLLVIFLFASLFFLAFGLKNNNANIAHAQNAQAGAPGIAVINLNTDKTSFTAAENVILHVTITNPNSYPISILKWDIPSVSITEPLFTILINGIPVKYLGSLSTRLAPTEQDYITLQAGENQTRDVNVSSYYDFSASGTYAIVYNVSSGELYADLSNGFTKSAGQLASNEVDLFVEGRPNLVHKKIAALSVTGTNSFSSCNISQQSTLNTVRSSASTYASESLGYFNSGSKGLRYVTWFGLYDPTLYNTVKSNYSAISSAIDTAGIHFDCSSLNDPPNGYYCDANTVAYVFPSWPYDIYLCSSYWSFPVTGNFSEAGVVIHEMSHFYGTNDWAYGRSGSQSLASNIPPNKAITNADNYRYFSENTPPIFDTLEVISITRASSNPTSASSVNFTVTFSKSVTGVDVTDFHLTTTGISGAYVTAVGSDSGTIRTVTINTGTGRGIIRLDVMDDDSIVDGSGNALGGTGNGNGNFTSGETYLVRPLKLFLPLILR